MNILQSVQSVRSASDLATALAQRRSVGDIVGAVAGTVYAAQTGGLGSLGSGVVADLTSSVVDGVGSVVYDMGNLLLSAVQTGEEAVESVVDGVSSAIHSTAQAGRAIAAYTSHGMQKLSNAVDYLV